MSQVIDVRGREVAAGAAAVLADPSGRRARRFALAGRAVAIVGLLWLAGLVLAGLGIVPTGIVPLGGAVAGPGAPPTLRALSVKPGTASDLAPALPAVGASRAGAAGGGSVQPGHGAQLTAAGSLGSTGARRSRGAAGSGKHGTAPRHGGAGAGRPTRAGAGTPVGTGNSGGTTAPAGTKPSTGNRAATGRAPAPGQTTKQTVPGQTKTTAPGNSLSAPGQIKHTTTTTKTTTTTTPAQSGSAAGQTVPHGTGHGHST